MRTDLDKVSVAIALISAFDGPKALHDTLTEGGTELFASGAEALGAMMVAGAWLSRCRLSSVASMER
ncbi:hypothetical protein VX037_09120 [Gordonia sp. Z-3]|jgi:hypothetical protein|uniref:Uncharacterized protein n=1 Tax=Gordonia tangerina TaxID=2911060 RepID=A0ABS9DCS5_9ACTN|nr:MULTISPECIES: hypothetical protein [Gordonia]MAU83158.1 hypothetical protein [Gordonia sp. (in: high G+C Gram-positive bacteria)]MCF3936913.1 hypothetical protein [Gordonia tangerina]MDY6811356.1 hypothetical protein [Actinomycetota bacterium]MED5801182.1 hypothetical protein [Gordonia sp. Z-3]